jgi:short-subunit dehydrogenase
MPELTYKVAVITGSANGLGKELAREFFRRGYNLALLDIDTEGLEKIKNELTNDIQIVTVHTTDISKEEQVITTRLEILQKHKTIDILINNAGVSISQTFDQVTVSDFKWLFEINFWGTVYCSKHFLADLRKEDNSHLVNIISNFALVGFPGKTTYASSKSAIMGFTNSLKTELVYTNIKVSLVIPPTLDTGLVRNGKYADEQKHRNEISFIAKKGMPIEKAAKKIVLQVIKGKYRIVIGSRMFLIDLLSRLFPTTIHRLTGKYKRQFDFV